MSAHSVHELFQQAFQVPNPGSRVEQRQVVLLIKQMAAQAPQFGRLTAQGDGFLLVGLGC